MKKLKNYLTDVEVLCALEQHMPQIRALHAAILPTLRTLSEWDTEEINKFDKSIARRLTAYRLRIDSAFSRFSIARLNIEKLDEFELNAKVELEALLTVTWAAKLFAKLLEEAHTAYAVPYQVVSSRLGGKLPHSDELQQLHVCYGIFTQRRLKLDKLLTQVMSQVEVLAEFQPGFTTLYDLCIESIAACTDGRDAFMELKDAHQYAYERIKSRS